MPGFQLGDKPSQNLAPNPASMSVKAEAIHKSAIKALFIIS
jgi:hypothetical protein